MTKKRWIALSSVLGIVIAAALTTAAVMNHGERHARRRRLAARSCPSTTATTVRPTTTTRIDDDDGRSARSCPHPEPPPADPYAATPIVQIGSIQIPKIGLLHPVFEGITLTVIDHGPGSLARIRDAVSGRQHRVPGPSGHAHPSVPQSRPPFSGRSDRVPHAGPRLRLQGDRHADRAADALCT